MQDANIRVLATLPCIAHACRYMQIFVVALSLSLTGVYDAASSRYSILVSKFWYFHRFGAGVFVTRHLHRIYVNGSTTTPVTTTA